MTGQITDLLHILKDKVLVRYHLKYSFTEKQCTYHAEHYAIRRRHLVWKCSSFRVSGSEIILFDGRAQFESFGFTSFLESRACQWAERDCQFWLEPKQFVGVVTLGDWGTRVFPPASPYFTFLHGYLLAELGSEMGRLYEHAGAETNLPDTFAGGIYERFKAFVAEQQRDVMTGMFGK